MKMNANPHAGAGAGKLRDPWEIKKWMDAKPLSRHEVLAKTGLKSMSIVSRTIAGAMNNKKVLRVLAQEGCPLKALSLPKELQEELM